MNDNEQEDEYDPYSIEQKFIHLEQMYRYIMSFFTRT